MSLDWGLLRERDFRHLFIGAVLATLGMSVAQLALPLTAVELLHAGPVEMGVLGALELLPFALFGLPAGAWIDRSYKRRLAMRFEVLAMGALLLVPATYLAGRLTMEILYAVGFLTGCCFAIGGSAMQVLVAQIVGRDRLLEANSRIIGAESVSALLGPALAATLIGAFGAPIAVTATALGLFCSVLALASIRRDDPPLPGDGSAWWREAGDGLRFVWSNPLLRAMAVIGAAWVLLFEGFRAMYVLFATHDLGLSPSDIAIANALGAIGALLGARSARRVERELGARAGLVGGYLLGAIGIGLFAAGGGVHALGYSGLIGAGAGFFVLDFGATLYVVTYLSLRQQITPDHLMGRMTSTMRFLTVAPAPIGAFLAGQGADALGIGSVLFLVSGLGAALALFASEYLPATAAAKAAS